MKASNGIRPRQANALLQDSLFANVFVIAVFVITAFVITVFVIDSLLALCILTVLYAFSSNLSDDAAKVNQLGNIGISAREQVVL